MSFKKTLLLEFTDFQDFTGPLVIFKDLPVLKNATCRLKFKYSTFQDFQDPYKRTLSTFTLKKTAGGIRDHT